MASDKKGRQRIIVERSVAPFSDFELLAGASAPYGKIGTIANAAFIYVVCDCTDEPHQYLDWLVNINQQFTYQFFRAEANPLLATLTLADATAVDATDTFVFNGLTYTCVAEEADAADREYDIGVSNDLTAASLATILQGAYGIPGVTASGAVAGTGNDAITLTGGLATTFQFGQGTSASNEIAFADATLTNLYNKDAASGNTALSSTMKGTILTQTLDGFPFGVLKVTNTSGSAAATAVVRALRR